MREGPAAICLNGSSPPTSWPICVPKVRAIVPTTSITALESLCTRKPAAT